MMAAKELDNTSDAEVPAEEAQWLLKKQHLEREEPGQIRSDG
jgi:hypothetical protein